MLWVVLPVVIAPRSITAAVDILPIGIIYVGVPVGVVHEIVVVVNCYVIITSPTGVAAPSPAAPSRSNSHAHAERNRHARSVIARRRVIDWRIGIHGRSVYDCGAICGNIDHLRIGLLDHDYSLAFHHLGFHLHLLIGF